MRKSLLLSAITLLMATSAWSQRNCGTMDYLQMQLQQDPTLAQRMQAIETFTQNYVANHPSGERTLITIPVVVHVVYKTSAQNISDAQVQAQIAQLNADFARTNSDAGNTPSVWQSTAANCEVQFCLAQRDPSGNATNGIIHKLTTATSFSTNDFIKHNGNGGDDAWPAGSYLNLWSGNLGGGLLGYAQFPGGSASTDGVVVLYSSIGSLANPGTLSPYNFGRTATHEIGHWLNLFHIWGDDGTSCSGSDQVADTPNQGSENYGCPAFPHTDNCTAGNGVMFMNYMDYTDDGCMNMFTAGQKTRMQALFVSGGSRFSIVSSQGCVPPSGGSCGLPTGLNTTSITTSSATLNWSSVSGATSYNVQYRNVGNLTWTPTTSSTNSKPVSGLTANTQYEFQVQAVCSSGSSAFTASSNFTTLSNGGSCSNTFEPNNTKATAAAISTGTDYLSQISSSTDLDWYSFANTSTQKNIRVTLTTLPGDYDIRLYNPSGTNVQTSQNGGTTSETIIYNTTTVGTYKLKVYGYQGAFSTTQCYTLHADISSSPFRLEAGSDVSGIAKSDLNIFPNPVLDNMTVQFNSDEKGDVILNVYNLLGQKMYSASFLALEGQNTFNMNVSDLQKGAYFLEVRNGDDMLRSEFVIAK